MIWKRIPKSWRSRRGSGLRRCARGVRAIVARDLRSGRGRCPRQAPAIGTARKAWRAGSGDRPRRPRLFAAAGLRRRLSLGRHHDRCPPPPSRHAAGGNRLRPAGTVRAAASARAAGRPDHRDRCGQGVGRDGARGRDAWDGPLEGWSSRNTDMRWPASRSRLSRPAIRCPMRPARPRPRAFSSLRRRGRGRSGAVSHLRRRIGADAAAGGGARPGRQAGGKPGTAAIGRGYRRDELRAQASLGHQGRAARRGGRPGTAGDPADFGRSRRRPVGDRIGADGRRSDDHGGCPGDPEQIRYRRPAARSATCGTAGTRRRSRAIRGSAARRLFWWRHRKWRWTRRRRLRKPPA